MQKNNQDNKYQGLIIALSIIIPLSVALLFGIKIPGYDLSFLPPIYAGINALTAIILLLALTAIRVGNRKLHELLMKICLGLSASFLVMYVLYHMTSENTVFQGTHFAKGFYYTVLISHIVLSIAVVPLVLFTFVRALNERFDKHKKLAKITFPIWLYVAVSGVMVYLMISPYYTH